MLKVMPDEGLKYLDDFLRNQNFNMEMVNLETLIDLETRILKSKRNCFQHEEK
jgi:hypothetical protein